MDKIISFNFPIEEFETIQKTWISDVLNSSTISKGKEEELITSHETAQL